MNLKEYQEIINKTAIYPFSMGMAYCLLGLDGEFGEFIEAVDSNDKERKVKECGDVWWYLTAFASKELELDISKVFVPADITFSDLKATNYVKQFITEKSKLSEFVKKFYRDNKGFDVDLLVPHIRRLSFNLRAIMALNELDYGEVLETNYNKLIKRRETNTLHGSGDNRENNKPKQEVYTDLE